VAESTRMLDTKRVVLTLSYLSVMSSTVFAIRIRYPHLPSPALLHRRLKEFDACFLKRSPGLIEVFHCQRQMRSEGASGAFGMSGRSNQMKLSVARREPNPAGGCGYALARYNRLAEFHRPLAIHRGERHYRETK
jgi:hypothetical protein